jgi:hypothetical protein
MQADVMRSITKGESGVRKETRTRNTKVLLVLISNLMRIVTPKCSQHYNSSIGEQISIVLKLYIVSTVHFKYMNKIYQIMHLYLLTLTNIPRHVLMLINKGALVGIFYSYILKLSVAEFLEPCLDLLLQTLVSTCKPSPLITGMKFQERSSLPTQKLLANKIDVYIGFNLLKPAYFNEMIVKAGAWRHAVYCNDDKNAGRKLFTSAFVINTSQRTGSKKNHLTFIHYGIFTSFTYQNPVLVEVGLHVWTPVCCLYVVTRVFAKDSFAFLTSTCGL